MNCFRCHIFVLLVSVPIMCRSEDEESVDYDYVETKVSRLKQEGAEYLQKVMNQLQNDRLQAQTLEVPDPGSYYYTQKVFETPEQEIYQPTPIYNISGPTPVPDIEAQIIPQSPPPLELSKDELLALYEAAVVKANHLQEEAKPEENHQLPLEHESVKPALQGQMGSPVSGYYYYYFPIKSFLKPQATPAPTAMVTTQPPQQLHATVTMMETPNNKSVEPLFMAISGFIGMALMFFFSVLFVPKFAKLRSKHSQIDEEEAQMAHIGQIVLAAMKGKDCSERLACEVTKIFKGLKSDNKSLRVLEIILPPNLAEQISQIRRAAGKNAKCGYIPCKLKKTNSTEEKPPIKTYKLKPWKKKETAHELWMKHFEEKQPQKKEQREEPPPVWREEKVPQKKPPREEIPVWKPVRRQVIKQQTEEPIVWKEEKQKLQWQWEEQQLKQQLQRLREQKLKQQWRRQWEQQQREEKRRQQEWQRQKEQMQKIKRQQQTRWVRKPPKNQKTNPNSSVTMCGNNLCEESH